MTQITDCVEFDSDPAVPAANDGVAVVPSANELLPPRISFSSPIITDCSKLSEASALTSWKYSAAQSA